MIVKKCINATNAAWISLGVTCVSVRPAGTHLCISVTTMISNSLILMGPIATAAEMPE